MAHAKGYLRDAFTEWVEQYWTSNETGPADVGGEERPIAWLLGKLWNCTDCLPGSICDDLEISRGSTYAVGVRKVKRTLDDEK